MEAKWTAIAGIVAFVIGIIIAPMMISYLRKLKFGQQIITEYGPTWHKKKARNTDYGRNYFYFLHIRRLFRRSFPVLRFVRLSYRQDSSLRRSDISHYRDFAGIYGFYRRFREN